MTPAKRRAYFGAALGATVAFCVTLALHAAPPEHAGAKQQEQGQAVAGEAFREPAPLSVDAARERAKLMHQIYAATLDVLHDRYFHDDRAMVPARAMEDVFSEMARQSNGQARWISVNTQAMSIGHEPKTDFEKNAAKALAAGQESWELVEKGRYFRAAPIALGAGCISCHTGFFAKQPKTPRFAGLVISMPVQDK